MGTVQRWTCWIKIFSTGYLMHGLTLFCGHAESTPKSVGTTTSSDMETPELLSVRAGQSTNSSQLRVQQDSILANDIAVYSPRYVDRFRHGRPQSREERRAQEKQQPCWWMSPSSSPCSSTPTKTTDKDGIQPLKYDHGFAIFSPDGQHRHDRSLSPCRRSLSMLSDTSQGEFDDTEIQHLQEKASRLLLKGECSQSDGSNPVSSEGLECSDFSSPIRVYEQVRRPFHPIKTQVSEKVCSDSVQTMFCQNSSVLPFVVPPTRREEDILFQWRLRRKIEQAREGLHSSLHDPTSNWPAPSSSRLSASGPAYKQHRRPEFSQKSSQEHIIAPWPQTKEAPGSSRQPSDPSCFPAFVVSSSSVSQPKATAQVPAHMHLLCDVLPCRVQSSPASFHQHLPEGIDESQTKVVCEKTQMLGNSIHQFTEERDREHTPSLPSSGAVERAELIHHSGSEVEREEKSQTTESKTKKPPSFGKKKKSTRCTAQRERVEDPTASNRSSSNKPVPKIVVQRQQEKRESSARDHPPPTSPIHSALGQVVAEVLFPTVAPSPGLKSPVLSVSPPCAASEPPQSSVPSATAHNSMEVISQLLQEAEDSDEKEFEDDPLLQVLRRQRKWVKKRISEVDSMLNEFLEE
ncbi:proline and serine-rich protein 3 isoform 3-T3 [Spinachia spinachia]